MTRKRWLLVIGVALVAGCLSATGALGATGGREGSAVTPSDVTPSDGASFGIRDGGMVEVPDTVPPATSADLAELPEVGEDAESAYGYFEEVTEPQMQDEDSAAG